MTIAKWMAAGGVLVCLGTLAYGAVAQEASQPGKEPQKVEIPATATVLEGIPTVRIDSAEGAATRRLLNEAEAAKSRLRISVVDGLYYWTSRENRLLRLDSSGPFTYLSSDPGKYIRLTRLNNKITYVEHVDSTLGSVTWWGELRIR